MSVGAPLLILAALETSAAAAKRLRRVRAHSRNVIRSFLNKHGRLRVVNVMNRSYELEHFWLYAFRVLMCAATLRAEPSF
jgi:hypothetical protein